MERPNFLAYVNARRKGIRAIEAIAQSRAKPCYAGYPDFYMPESNITRQPDRPRYAWIENTESAGLRFVDYASDIVRRLPRGWYCDEFQDKTFRGAVWRLPHGRGYLAGYADPWNDGAAFVELAIIEDLDDAARAADSIAEFEAEKERDYQAEEREKFEQEEREAERVAEMEQAAIEMMESRPDLYMGG